MTKHKIVYIDDQESSRSLFSELLQNFLGDECFIVTPELENNIEEMLHALFFSEACKDASTYIIDEKLCITGLASYQGSQLAEKIRSLDEKIPVYILTSYADDVDQLSGSIEFVIDKNDISKVDKGTKIAQRILRHINVYQDIRTARNVRFDELLLKSLNDTLSESEVSEFNTLNVLRSRIILIDEYQPSKDDEQKEIEQNEILEKIMIELEKIKRG